MSEAVLAALIFSLCKPLPQAERLACFDSYVNCAIEDKIMTKEEFDKHCKPKMQTKEQ